MTNRRQLVQWEDNDPQNPRNWSTLYKIWLTFQLGMLALSASLGSSIISPADDTIAKVMGASQEAAILCISLYMYALPTVQCSASFRQNLTQVYNLAWALRLDPCSGLP